MRNSFRILARLSVFAVVLLPGWVPAQAGLNRWTPVGPYGGDAEGLVIAPSDPRVLLMRGGPLYKSVDGGDSWRLVRPLAALQPGPVAGMAFDPADAARITVITGAGSVYASGDGGASWVLLGQGPSGAHTLLIDPATPSLLYAVTVTRVFRSSDGGRTWTAGGAVPGPWMEAVAMVPGSPGVLYAGVFDSAGAVYRSGDGGATWEPKGLDLPRFNPSYAVWVAVAPDHPDTLFAAIDDGYPAVYKSVDGGASWVRSGPGGYPVAVGPAGAVYTRGARSLDGGATWTATPPPASQEQHMPLVADPVTPTRAYAVDRTFGIVRTVDAAASWQDANQGIAGLRIPALAFAPATPGVLYASGPSYGRLWRKEGGAPWQPIDFPAELHVEVSDGLLLAVDRRATVYALSSFGQLLVSADGGDSWREIAPPAGNRFENTLLAVDPLHPRILLAGAAGYPSGCRSLRSTDGGKSWKCMSLGIVRRVVFDPRRPGVVYAVRTKLLRSLDSGATWSFVGRGLPLGASGNDVAIDPVHPDTLYLATDRGVYKSVKGGAWKAVSAGLPADEMVTAVVADPRDPDRLFAGVRDRGVYRSTDAGRTWSPMNQGLSPIATPRLLEFDPFHPEDLYLSTEQAGLYRITLPGD